MKDSWRFPSISTKEIENMTDTNLLQYGSSPELSHICSNS